MTTTTKSVFALALEAGIKPFDLPPDVAKDSIGDTAASLLNERNPYFTKEYRQRYNIKVHALEVSTQRLALGCVESAAPADNEDARRFRAVIFRCDGNVIYQTPTTACSTTTVRLWTSGITCNTLTSAKCWWPSACSRSSSASGCATAQIAC